MRAAITFIPETGRISPMYDVARHVIVCRLCRCATVPEAVVPAVDFPEDRASREKFFAENRVSFLITGAISNDDVAELNRLGITVCPFATGDWREVWQEWVGRRRLSSCHLMPGCRSHHQKCCRGKEVEGE